jgi:hypothetical protein
VSPFDGFGIASDVNGTVAFGRFEDGKGVQGWSVFDVAGLRVEAS